MILYNHYEMSVTDIYLRIFDRLMIRSENTMYIGMSRRSMGIDIDVATSLSVLDIHMGIIYFDPFPATVSVSLTM